VQKELASYKIKTIFIGLQNSNHSHNLLVGGFSLSSLLHSGLSIHSFDVNSSNKYDIYDNKFENKKDQ
jgi:hypothetical protein